MPADARIGRAKAAIRKARLYNMYSWCNHFAPWSLGAFCISVPLFLVGAWIAGTQSEFYGTIVCAPAAAVVLLSGVAYPLLLALRDEIASGRIPWRFSLRMLLIVTTLLAMELGLFLYATRNL